MNVSLNVISMTALLGALLIHPVSADDSAKMFNKLDANGDGYISEYEALEHDELTAAFSEGDQNSDGLLNMAEFVDLEITED
jgi:Ca2+-binding EF-hand superfamily protein